MRLHKAVVVLCCISLTASCAGKSYDIFSPQKPDLIDPALKLNRDDYKNLNNPEPDADGKGGGAMKEPPIPDIAEILTSPKPPKLGETQLVSVAVTDDVPLKDVLIELARLADVDIEVDAGITGGINFHAKDRPFNEVIDRIADLSGLRYSMKNNILRVERDTPYVETYSLDFLNLDRTAQSSVNVSTSVLSSAGGGSGGGGGGASGGGASGGGGGGGSGGGGGGLDNGSSSTITMKADSDFWKQFEQSVKRILQYKPTKRVSETTIAEQPNAPAGASDAAAAAGAPAAAPAPAAPAPAADAADSGGAAGGGGTGSGGGTGGAFYVLNRQASTLTVSATDRQHAMVKEFLKKIQANASSQVLIEAKIVEVTLDDKFQSGIDWTKLGNSKISFASAFGSVTDTSNIATFTTKPGSDLSAAVQLAEAFGTTRTLSSPRLHAINNQEAVLTFADNQVYFTITVSAPTTTSVGNTSTTNSAPTVTSTAHTVPIGIILNLQPSIDTENNEITLSVHPTLSRIVKFVNDPGVAITVAQAIAALPSTASASEISSLASISSPIPVVEVRELDSVLKLKSGQVMVIGGLMQDISSNTDSGIPGASGIPWLGNLFKGVNRENETSELVIFIRATIVSTGGDADNADKDVYHKFTKDPRPATF